MAAKFVTVEQPTYGQITSGTIFGDEKNLFFGLMSPSEMTILQVGHVVGPRRFVCRSPSDTRSEEQ